MKFIQKRRQPMKGWFGTVPWDAHDLGTNEKDEH